VKVSKSAVRQKVQKEQKRDL